MITRVWICDACLHLLFVGFPFLHVTLSIPNSSAIPNVGSIIQKKKKKNLLAATGEEQLS